MLDEEDAITRIDKQRMLGMIWSAPDQLRKSSERVEAAGISARERVRNVIVAGIGGSAMAGEYVFDLAREQIKLPLAVCRDLMLPAYANEGTLVILVSYSGGTWETLQLFEQAIERKCSVISICSGGELASRCRDRGIPLVNLATGLLPRAALPQMFASILLILSKYHLISDPTDEILKGAELLSQMKGDLGQEIETNRNLAKKMALALFGKFPVIYCLESHQSLAKRFQSQLAENSKVPSKIGTLPDACHNDIEALVELLREKKFATLPIFIRSTQETDVEKIIINGMIEAVKEKGASEAQELLYPTRSRLETVLAMTLLIDLCSFYLAILRRVDPSEIALIDLLKLRIGRSVQELALHDIE
jgi:glucose/mannose-6-phosphate isomerase